MNGAKHSAGFRGSLSTSRAARFFAEHGWRLADDTATDEHGKPVAVYTLYKDDEQGNPVFMYTPLGRSGIEWPKVQTHYLKTAEIGWERYCEERGSE